VQVLEPTGARHPPRQNHPTPRNGADSPRTSHPEHPPRGASVPPLGDGQLRSSRQRPRPPRHPHTKSGMGGGRRGRRRHRGGRSTRGVIGAATPRVVTHDDARRQQPGPPQVWRARAAGRPARRPWAPWRRQRVAATTGGQARGSPRPRPPPWMGRRPTPRWMKGVGPPPQTEGRAGGQPPHPQLRAQGGGGQRGQPRRWRPPPDPTGTPRGWQAAGRGRPRRVHAPARPTPS